jgi:F-type H+-transporting ATPase subunit gamma
MEQLEKIKNRIDNATELKSLVTIMKTLSAAKVMEYGRAVASLEEFNKTIELGLQVVLKTVETPDVVVNDRITPGGGAIIVGSDQGLCGSFNQQISTYADEELEKLIPGRETKSIITVGDRVVQYLGKISPEIGASLHFPDSPPAINQLIITILKTIDTWAVENKIQKVFIFYNKPGPGDVVQPFTQKLLPMDLTWLTGLVGKKWPGKTLPTFTMERNMLLGELLRQHLFYSLYTALIESLVSENRSRLSAMQAADRNIDSKLEKFKTEYHSARQAGITAELLDIVTGYEVITKSAQTPTVS